MSKSNIYYHFTSKEELALAVAEHWIEQHETMLTSLILQTNRSAEERMLEIFHALSDDLRDRSCQGGCPFLSLYMQTHSSTVRTRIRRFFSEQIPLIEQLLKQGMASNEFRSDLSVKETASLFISTIEGALMMAETSGDPQVVCETGQAMLRLLLKP
ncbi:AcrR family transcriptional regulator [Desmospora profundinema]|uniref:AcrR family transcriptional regulator n=1 Tax=Desmospora profundinema TaxID=1571184 RepID=A0ABU1II04_9BACL|nr:AcrR family transcriptional regulator [Desmospora profundinema]